jgi:hypothetical protein
MGKKKGREVNLYKERQEAEGRRQKERSINENFSCGLLPISIKRFVSIAQR